MVLCVAISFSQQLQTHYNIVLSAGGGTINIPMTKDYAVYYIDGTATLTSNWTIQPSGTAYEGITVVFYYNGGITLSGNTLTIFSKTITEDYADIPFIQTCYYDGSSWIVTVTPDAFQDNIVSTSSIKDEAVTLDKLTDLTQGSMWIGGASDRPVELDLKRAGYFIVGNGTTVIPTLLSGDVSGSATGAITIMNNAVENIMLNSNVAGDGIQLNGVSNAIDVDVSDFAGNGLEDDGSENLQVKPDVTNGTSVVTSVDGVRLSGDANSPGNTYYYGTNGSGTKGWYSLTSFGVNIWTDGGSVTYLTTKSDSVSIGNQTASERFDVDGNIKCDDIRANRVLFDYTDDYLIDTVIIIPSDSILVCNTRPQTLIEAPGAGKVIEIVKVMYYLDFNTTPYGGSPGFISIQYENGGSNTLEEGYITASNDSLKKLAFNGDVAINDKIQFTTISADPTTGDSPVKIYITFYRREL